MNNETKYEAKRSLGFTWDLPQDGLHILRADNPEDALFTFHKYRVEHVSKTLRTLEHIPCTIAQTRTILDGKGTSGLTTRQLRAVENYGLACEALVDILESGRFVLDKDTVCGLHAIIGKDEAKHVGKFRGHQVLIEQSHYLPPKSDHLEGIFTEGINYLNSIENVQERAICTFLFLSRSQFFSDCNKRTANLVMNGILMQNGFHPVSIDSETFLEKMAEFYESATATKVIAEINDIAKRQYHVEGAEKEIQSTQREHTHLLDTATVYTDALKTYTQAKEAQAQRIESKLETAVTIQRAVVEESRAHRPGLVSSLWRGKAWGQRHQAQAGRLQVLERRLERVRGIRKDMGGKRLAELGRKKLQRDKSELVAKHDTEERIRRERQADEALRQARDRVQTQSRGRGMKLEK